MEIEESEEMKAYDKRWERNQKLQETDKYLIADYPITAENLEKVKVYRDTLRHLPEDKNFPNVEIPILELD